MKMVSRLAASLALAACLAAPVSAQEGPTNVSPSVVGPGVEVEEAVLGEAAEEAALGEGAEEAVLGEQAQQMPIVLPRTGGLGGPLFEIGLLGGLTFTAIGLQLRRRRGA